MEIAICILFILLGYISVHKSTFFSLEEIPKLWIHFAFTVKLLAALCLYLIYTRYYTDRETADIFKYYDDARALFHVFMKSPAAFWKFINHVPVEGELGDYISYNTWHWNRFHDDWIFNDNRTIIIILFLLLFITGGYYAPLVVLLVFISSLGLTGIYKFIGSHIANKARILFIVLFFMPSIILWTSGILKESLLFAFLGIFLVSLQKLIQKRYWALILFCVGFLGLALLKYYVLVSLLPGLLLWSWHRIYPNVKLHTKSIIVFGALLLLVILNHYLLHIFPLLKAITMKHNDFVEWMETTNSAGSYIRSDYLLPTFSSILAYIPSAWINVFFRPLPWELSNILMFVPAAENMLLFAMVIFMIFSRDKNDRATSFIVLSLSFVLFLFTITSLVSPVIGALVRYKVPALPFLFAAIIAKTNFNGIKGYRILGYKR